MKGSLRTSINKYFRSWKLPRFFPASKFSWSLLFSSAPLLLCSSAVISIAAPQQTVQVIAQSSISRPNLKIGSKGDFVSELQAALKLLGYYAGAVDGVYNDNTSAAVSKFQQAAGLAPDGVVGLSTWQKLYPGVGNVASSSSTTPTNTNNQMPFPSPSARRSTPRVVTITEEPRPGTPESDEEPRPASPRRANQPTPRAGQSPRRTQPATRTTENSDRPRRQTRSNTSERQTPGRNTSSSNRNTPNTDASKAPVIQYTSQGLPILRLGMRGSEVVKLQERLSTLGYLQAGVDGDFGVATENAVKAIQQRFGLEPDGVVGGATWDIINRPRRTTRSQ